MAEPHTESYYAATRSRDTHYPLLAGSVDCDVCICGAGFTGIATALTLAERGYRVVVLEQNRIAWGASGRNGGQLIGGISGQAHMVKQLGTAAADAVWDIAWRGNTLVRERVKKYAIDCDLKWGYMDVALKPRHMRGFRQDYETLLQRGFGDDLEWVERERVQDFIGSKAYIGGLVNRRSGHLHPLNLCLGEAAAAVQHGVRFYEDTEVLDIEHGARPLLRTPSGEVRADAVILAGNAYQRLEMRRLGGLVFPAGSYIIATEPLSAAEAAALNPRDLAFCDPNHVLDYFRLSADRRLLFGGRCNYSGHAPRSIRASIEPRMLRIFPQLKGKRIDYAWGGNIGIVVNRVPLVGRLQGNVYYALGYSGHGVNATHAMGEILADAIGGTLERFDLFQRIRHRRLPFGETLDSQLLALGMLYFRIRDLL